MYDDPIVATASRWNSGRDFSVSGVFIETNMKPAKRDRTRINDKLSFKVTWKVKFMQNKLYHAARVCVNVFDFEYHINCG